MSQVVGQSPGIDVTPMRNDSDSILQIFDPLGGLIYALLDKRFGLSIEQNVTRELVCTLFIFGLAGLVIVYDYERRILRAVCGVAKLVQKIEEPSGRRPILLLEDNDVPA